MFNKFSIYLKAKNPVIIMVSHEIERIWGLVNRAKEEVPHINKWYVWNCVQGLREFTDNGFRDIDKEIDIGSLLDSIQTDDSFANSIILIENSHFFINESDYKNIQRIKLFCNSQIKNKHIILQQADLCLPKEIEKDVIVMYAEYPSIEDLEIIYEEVCKEFGITASVKYCRALLDSLLGLTIMEARSALKQAVVEKGYLDDSCDSVILETKEQIIKKTGYLEFYSPKEELNDVGGLENLKSWLKKRRKAYIKRAKDFGLQYPKGILLLGVPGTGKSLTAKAIAAEWKFPLLRLDMGKMFGGIVGQSESNIRNALSIAEALSPSILWIDEIEKGLSGSSGSGENDGGVSLRILGTFLTWMQEKKKAVFVVATANNISKLPPELLRKGRVDEIFFVDIPGTVSRKEIFKIHIKKLKKDIGNFNLDNLAKESEHYTGAEIESAILEALFTAYGECTDDSEEPPLEEPPLEEHHIIEALKKTIPISYTMKEVIKDLRSWAKSRAVNASTEDAVEIKSDDNIPMLAQEEISPFLKKSK